MFLSEKSENKEEGKVEEQKENDGKVDDNGEKLDDEIEGMGEVSGLWEKQRN